MFNCCVSVNIYILTNWNILYQPYLCVDLTNSFELRIQIETVKDVIYPITCNAGRYLSIHMSHKNC